MAYSWIMQMATKTHLNLLLREYAIMKVVHTSVIAYIWIWHDHSEAEFETLAASNGSSVKR